MASPGYSLSDWASRGESRVLLSDRASRGESRVLFVRLGKSWRVQGTLCQIGQVMALSSVDFACIVPWS